MILSLPRLPDGRQCPQQIRVAWKHRQKGGADLFHLHAGLAAAFQNHGNPPGDAVLPQNRRQLDKGPRIFGADVHVHRGVRVVAELHALPALADRVGIKKLIPQRRPKQLSLQSFGSTLLRAARHDRIAGQARPPIRPGHFAVHDLSCRPQSLMRFHDGEADIMCTQRIHHPRDKGAVSRRHDLAAKINPLRISHGANFGGIRLILRLQLLALFLGQHGRPRPQHEVSGFPAHQARPEFCPLCENIAEIETGGLRDNPAGTHIGVFDFNECRIRIGNVIADDRVATGFQRARDFKTHRLGDFRKGFAFGHALHAVDAEPGHIMAGLGDKGVTMRGFQIAIGRQSLFQ